MGDAYRIETREQLRELMGEPSEFVTGKIEDTLSDFARDFIARSPFLVLSTANAESRQDASPKGDPPGFVAQVVAFAFGLLHGLGFAGALTSLGLPAGDIPLALLFFNVGVEIGQLAIILLGFLLVGFWFRNKDWYRAVIIIPGSAAIGLTGLYWTFDRIVV